ncbi:hypothetical protein BGX38DRAFT_639861 [Terfezia claveryi]|nr:hypothetical protein BGX38DRAFT_639861 [Terfezia claveryi]
MSTSTIATTVKKRNKLKLKKKRRTILKNLRRPRRVKRNSRDFRRFLDGIVYQWRLVFCLLLSVAWRLGKIMKLDGNHFRKRFSHILFSSRLLIASIFAWLMIGYSGFFNGFRTDVSKSYVLHFAFIAFCSCISFDPSVSQVLLEGRLSNFRGHWVV